MGNENTNSHTVRALDSSATGGEAPSAVAHGELADRAVATLIECGFEPQVAQRLTCLAPRLRSTVSSDVAPFDSSALGLGSRSLGGAATRRNLMGRAEAALVMSRWCEAELLTITRSMAIAAGEELLPELGVASTAELSVTQAKRWRACAKSAVASELNALAGWGIQSCHDRVGLSLAPRPISERAIGALRQGWNDSRAVLDFWHKVRGLSVESATLVGDAALGSHPDGDGQPARPSSAEFTQRLTRSVISVEGAAATARRRRHDRLLDRDFTAVVDDDGVGSLITSGSAASVAAAALRVDTIARKARAAGDPRAIAQIRSDLALALIIHGSISDEGEGVHGALAEVGPLVRAALDRHAAPVQLEVVVPLDALLDPESRDAAYVPGVGAITSEHARELALAPGTTIFRLLTDSADGRCIERSTISYLPDQDMLNQIRAVDRTCRGPGCVRDARHCQPDHEQPFDQGGATSESNLVLKHSFHHNNKTLKIWQSELHPDRRVTWKTLFDRSYVTRPFDYRELSFKQSPCLGLPNGRKGRDMPASGDGSTSEDRPRFDDRPTMGDAPPSDSDIYLALAESWREGSLTPMSDEGDAAETAALISMRHHTPGGAVRPGPSPEVLAAASKRQEAHENRNVLADPDGGFALALANDPPPF